MEKPYEPCESSEFFENMSQHTFEKPLILLVMGHMYGSFPTKPIDYFEDFVRCETRNSEDEFLWEIYTDLIVKLGRDVFFSVSDYLNSYACNTIPVYQFVRFNLIKPTRDKRPDIFSSNRQIDNFASSFYRCVERVKHDIREYTIGEADINDVEGELSLLNPKLLKRAEAFLYSLELFYGASPVSRYDSLNELLLRTSSIERVKNVREFEQEEAFKALFEENEEFERCFDEKIERNKNKTREEKIEESYREVCKRIGKKCFEIGEIEHAIKAEEDYFEQTLIGCEKKPGNGFNENENEGVTFRDVMHFFKILIAGFHVKRVLRKRPKFVFDDEKYFDWLSSTSKYGTPSNSLNYPLNVYIEGPVGVGKSTLVKNLNRLFDEKTFFATEEYTEMVNYLTSYPSSVPLTKSNFNYSFVTEEKENLINDMYASRDNALDSAEAKFRGQSKIVDLCLTRELVVNKDIERFSNYISFIDRSPFLFGYLEAALEGLKAHEHYGFFRNQFLFKRKLIPQLIDLSRRKQIFIFLTCKDSGLLERNIRTRNRREVNEERHMEDEFFVRANSRLNVLGDIQEMVDFLHEVYESDKYRNTTCLVYDLKDFESFNHLTYVIFNDLRVIVYEQPENI